MEAMASIVAPNSAQEMPSALRYIESADTGGNRSLPSSKAHHSGRRSTRMESSRWDTPFSTRSARMAHLKSSGLKAFMGSLLQLETERHDGPGLVFVVITIAQAVVVPGAHHTLHPNGFYVEYPSDEGAYATRGRCPGSTWNQDRLPSPELIQEDVLVKGKHDLLLTPPLA